MSDSAEPCAPYGGPPDTWIPVEEKQRRQRFPLCVWVTRAEIPVVEAVLAEVARCQKEPGELTTVRLEQTSEFHLSKLAASAIIELMRREALRLTQEGCAK
jgi:hypothetical protein